MKFISIGENGEIKGLTETEWTLIVCLDASPDWASIINELKQSVNIDRVIELLKYYYRRLPSQVDLLRAQHLDKLALWRGESMHHTQYYFLSVDYRSIITSIIDSLNKRKFTSELTPLEEATLLYFKVEAKIIERPPAKELKKPTSNKLYTNLNDLINNKTRPKRHVIEKILPLLKSFPAAYQLATDELKK